MDPERVGIAVFGAKGVPKEGLAKSWAQRHEIRRDSQGKSFKPDCKTNEDNEDGDPEQLIRESDAFVLVYSLHHKDTFTFLEHKRKQIQAWKGTGPALVLVGIYSSEGGLALRQVTRQTALDTCQLWNCRYFELCEPSKLEDLNQIFVTALDTFIHRDVWFYDDLKIVRTLKKPITPESIKEVDCYGFHLGTNLPHGTQFGRLRALTLLNFSDNYLQSIPDLTGCSSLQKLLVCKNQIKVIEFENLPVGLRELHIAENEVESIGSCVSRLTALEVLNIQKNKQLTHISTDIYHLSFPKFMLDCTGNTSLKFDLDFSISPKKIKLDSQYSPQLDFWKKYPGVLTAEGKLLILGHGAAGKTSLLLHLQNGSLKLKDHELPNTISTIGLDIIPLRFHKSRVTLLAHDFAGQIEYMTSHKFFLSRSETSIYLVVVDVSLERAMIEENLKHWIGFLVGTVFRGWENANLILVGTKIDRILNFQDHREKIKQHMEMVVTRTFKSMKLDPPNTSIYFVSNCGSGNGIPELKNSLKQLSESKQGIYVPGILSWLQDKMGGINSVFLPGGEYANELNTKIKETDTFTTYLKAWPTIRSRLFRICHDLGILMYSDVDDIVCLKPDVFSKLTSAFLGPPEHQKRLTGKQVDAILQKNEVFEIIAANTVFQHQSQEVYETILKFMESMRLCFELKPQEAQHYGKSGYLFMCRRPYSDVLFFPMNEKYSSSLKTSGSLDKKFKLMAFQLDTTQDYVSIETFTDLQWTLREQHDFKYKLFINLFLTEQAEGQMLFYFDKEDGKAYVILRGFDPEGLFQHTLYPALHKVGDLRAIPLCPFCAHSYSFMKATHGTSGTLHDTCKHYHGLQEAFNDQPGSGFKQTFAIDFFRDHDNCIVYCSADYDQARVKRRALWEPLQGSKFYNQGRWHQTESITWTELTSDETIPERLQEYLRLRNLFFKFVGVGRKTDLVLSKIAFLRNPILEAKFSDYYANLAHRSLTAQQANQQWTKDQSRTLLYLSDYVERVSGNEKINLICGWHGTSEQGCWGIGQTNFLEPNQKKTEAKDEGYFGSGIYFTQYPSYGATYACGEGVLLLSWVLMGMSYPITEHPTGPTSFLGKPCMPGYDSHYVLVKGKYPTIFPALDPVVPDSDEIVVFSKDQILPRCIFYFNTQELRNSRRNDSSKSLGQRDASCILLWIDPSLSTQTKIVCQNLKTSLGDQLFVEEMTSTVEVVLWLQKYRTSTNVNRIKILTTRHEGERATDQFIHQIRSQAECIKIPIAIFCSPEQSSSLRHLDKPKKTFVTVLTSEADILTFCAKPDLKKSKNR